MKCKVIGKDAEKENEIIEINIVGEKRGDGVGYYKNYTIFIAGAEDKVGSKVKAEIEEVNSNKRVATAKIIG